MTAKRFVVRSVICASLLFSLFLYSCGSTRRSAAAADFQMWRMCIMAPENFGSRATSKT